MTEQNSEQHTAAPKLIAFYLPQFHPVPENDQWWGAGFTEWINVTRAVPRFAGHYQPHLPADTGFYDLRLPETRQLQAELAGQYGISGFCYYHYWFNGQRLLERPFNDVLQSGAPGFPFCLCWANENWTRKWDGKQEQILLQQTYLPQDDSTHIQWLLRAFTDPRYINVDGKPLFLFYRASKLPDIKRTASLWREAAEKHGLPGLCLCGVQSFPEEYVDPATQGLDAVVEFRPNCADTPRLQKGVGWDILRACRLAPRAYGTNCIYSYQKLIDYCLALPDFPYRRFPCVTPSWDNTARRAHAATIFKDANPSDYERWLEEVLRREISKRQHPSFVFINAWNEWAEGNHIEPCQKWGRSYLEATRAALERVWGKPPRRSAERRVEDGHATELSASH